MAFSFINSLRLTGSAALSGSLAIANARTAIILHAYSTSGPISGTPTYNGKNMTLLQRGTATLLNVYTWYMFNPDVGAYTLAIPNSSSKTIVSLAATFQAQLGYVPILDTTHINQESPSSSNPSVLQTAPTTAGNAIFAAVCCDSATVPTGSTLTEISAYHDVSAWSDAYQFITDAATDTTVGWTEPECNWVILTAALSETAEVVGYATHMHMTLTMHEGFGGGVDVNTVVGYATHMSMKLTMHESRVFVRMVGFIYSADIAYMIEFGHKYARFYWDGAPLMASSTHVEIATPYDAADLLQVQFRQLGDTMWCLHPSYPPQKLTRTTATAFTIAPIAFEKGPFLTRNDIEHQKKTDALYGASVTPSVIEAGDTGTLSASYPIFLPGNVGSIWQLTYPRTNLTTNGQVSGTATGQIGATITIVGDWTFAVNPPTRTSLYGTVRLEKSSDGTTWTPVSGTTFTSKHTISQTQADDGVDWQYRIYCTAHTKGIILASLTVKSESVDGSKVAPSTGVIKYPIAIKGDFTFVTHGTWKGTVVLEREENGTGWDAYRTYTSDNDFNVSLSATEDADNVLYRINVTQLTSGSVRGTLTSNTATESGIVQIDSVVSSTLANITVLTDLPQATSTLRWSEGAWSDVQGYPCSMCFKDDRSVYLGQTKGAVTVWFSETSNYENFVTDVKDADPFTLVIPCTGESRWVDSLDTVLAGTSGDEWIIRSNKLDSALTPTNYSVTQQTSYGSAPLQSIRVRDVVLFVDSLGRRVYETVFRYDQDKYVSVDLTEFAEHITKTGITSIAFQRAPDPILWCTLTDGSLVSLTYNREQNVVAWGRHPIDGKVQSVSTIPGDGEDEVWISVQRQIDGKIVVYVEQMASRSFAALSDAFFVDSGLTLTYATPETSITGLDHIEGEEVQILADGVDIGPATVSGGSVTLADAASVVQVGLPVVFHVEPMRVSFRSPGGDIEGSIVKITEVVVNLVNSADVQYGKDMKNLIDVDTASVDWLNTSEIDGLFSGDVVLGFDGGFSRDNPIHFTGDSPMPCTIRAIVARAEKNSR